jgi:hypothetical protein
VNQRSKEEPLFATSFALPTVSSSQCPYSFPLAMVVPLVSRFMGLARPSLGSRYRNGSFVR